jgi:hypothetical protein
MSHTSGLVTGGSSTTEHVTAGTKTLFQLTVLSVAFAFEVHF